MGQLINLIGKKFGRLLVIGPQARRKRLFYWQCRCDCGEEKWICGQALRGGMTKSCGCLQRERVSKRFLKEVSGQRFGRWLVLGPHISKQRKIFWLCKCDCGIEKWVEGQGVREGRRQSCGCLQRELAGKRSLKDISGQKFGRLQVLGSYIRKQGKIFWLCKCDCGKEKWIQRQALTSGATKSCGCFGREMRRNGSLEKRKKYKVILTTEQRRHHEAQIKEHAPSSEESLRSRVLLLADQSSDAPRMTDEEITKALSIGPRKAFYIRATFSDPEFRVRTNQKGRERLLDPRVRKLRLETLKRHEAKPETKARVRQYKLNRPPEAKARERERKKIYDQSERGKTARAREAARQRQQRQTPEGKAKTRIQFQRYKARVNKWYLERYRTDLQFRIRKRLSGRLRDAIKARGGRKSSSIVDLIGCSLQKVVDILESKFKQGMTWGNHGSWHIDHIIPCAHFDLTQIEEQKKCFHYSNLQPLWAIENIVKSNKLVSVPT